MNTNTQFCNFFISHFKLPFQQKTLLAVSGGLDSMVMLHLFHANKMEIGVAHCNFNLRGLDSDLDNNLVKDYCAQLSIPFYEITFDTAHIAQNHKTSIQVTARELRYNWFEQIRTENNYGLLATAHHQNDNAETILFNLVRGTGLAGMSGIPSKTDHIIRPLIATTKQQVEEYALKNNVPFRTDNSNTENKYARNNIRNQIMPLLTHINEASTQHIHEFGLYSQFVHRVLKNNMQKIESENLSTRNNYTVLLTQNIILNEDAFYILFELLHKYGFNSDQVKKIEQSILLQKTGNTFISNGFVLTVNRHECIIEPLESDHTLPSIALSKTNLPYRNDIGNKTLFLSIIPAAGLVLNEPHSQFLDFDRLADNIIIRPWKIADYFTPLGMKGRKKISDILIDAKTSIPDKKQTLVLVTNDEIATIISHQISEHYKVNLNTKRVLKIGVN